MAHRSRESNSYPLHLLRPDSRCTPRRNTGDLCLSCTVHLSHTGKSQAFKLESMPGQELFLSFWCFFHGDFRFHCVSISHASKKLLAPQGEELREPSPLTQLQLGPVVDSAPATSWSPRMERIMPRRRFQSGRVYQRGTRWVGSYREYEVNPETGKRARRTITFDA